MNIIKLNAIESTNSFLKELILTQFVDNFTIVITGNQTKGKGQVGAVWDSEPGKNLTFSVLVKDVLIESSSVFILNTLVSISIIKALEKFKIKNLAIKWPNDILSDQKKIAGILIENIFKGNNEIVSIVGIGLNINQLYFENLPQASSLAILNNKEFEKDLILEEIHNQIKFYCNQFSNNVKKDFWDEYHNYLFKKNIPSVFLDADNHKFMGIIKGVSSFGRLQVMLEDDTIKEFDLKEIKMLY
jgi:BirA family transcriptional regulator, biotin operon repressor / biotin---[acetyl-CoA-carboxylase] ligase